MLRSATNLFTRCNLLYNLSTSNYVEQVFLDHTVFSRGIRSFTTQSDQHEYQKRISSLCSRNLQDKAVQVFNEMKSKGISPNLLTYNILLYAFANRNRLEIVQDYLDEINSNPNLNPDHESFCALIRAKGLAEGIKEAKLVLLSMEKYNIQPKVEAYDELLYLCGEKQNLKEAKEYFEEMLEKGIRPTVNTYNRLIGVYLHTKNIEFSKQIAQNMKEEGIELNEETYFYLIKACGEANQFQELINTFKEMKANKKVNSMTSVAYAYLIEATIKCDRINEAVKCYEEMISEELLPLPRTFDVLVIYCEKNNFLEFARKIIQDLKDFNMTPTRHVERVEKKLKLMLGKGAFKKKE